MVLRRQISPNKNAPISKRKISRSTRIALAGVGCVGKTTVGKNLAVHLGIRFFDLDQEIEKFFGQFISQIQSQFLSDYSYRKHCLVVLKDIFEREKNFVLALSPGGLKTPYSNVLKKNNVLMIALQDSAENILDRLVFYDKKSKKLDIQLSLEEEMKYLKAIKRDISRYKKINKKADYQLNIEGLGVKSVTDKILLKEQFAII